MKQPDVETVAHSRVRELSSDRNARVTVISNRKGGVGKTTVALNMAGGLSRRGYRVLVIDCEPLESLTQIVLRPEDRPETSVIQYLFSEIPAEVLENPPIRREAGQSLLAHTVYPASFEPFYVVPSSEATLLAVDRTEGATGYEFDDAISLLRPYFDHIVIDLPGQLQTHLAISALTAADGVVIPVDASVLGMNSLAGTFGLIEKIRDDQNPHMVVDGYVLSKVENKADPRVRLVRKYLNTTGGYVFRTKLRHLVAYKDSSLAGRTVFAWNDPRSTYDFTQFLDEWEKRVQEVAA